MADPPPYQFLQQAFHASRDVVVSKAEGDFVYDYTFIKRPGADRP
jgi:hypothetical protein